MDNKETNKVEKITLPQNLQREMIKFFLRTSLPQIAQNDRINQQSLQILNEAED